MHKLFLAVNKQNSFTTKVGVAIGAVEVEAEFVHCCKYSVVDLQNIM